MNFRRSKGIRPKRARQINLLRACVLLAMTGLPCWTQAQDLSRLNFKGFGTLGAIYHEARDIEVRRSIGQSHGAEAGDIDLATDSRLALQVNATLSSSWQAVVQGMTRLNSDNSWSPRITRGFLRHEIDEALAFRVGRLGYDIDLLAESPDVGFSYLPVRPAGEYFGLIPSDYFDGSDVTATWPVGNGLLHGRLFLGQGVSEVAMADSTDSEQDYVIAGARVEYQHGAWQTRATVVRVNLRQPDGLQLLADALRAAGFAQSEPLASQFGAGKIHMNIFQAMASYDNSPFTGQLIATRYDSDNVVGPQSNSGVLTLGYRMGKFTPYTSFAVVKNFGEILPSGLPDAEPFAALAAAVHATQTSSRMTQHTTSAGIRHDFATNMDLKLQIDRSHLHETLLFFDRRVSSPARRDITVFSLALDFIF